MLSVELDIIKAWLAKDYDAEDIFLDDNMVIEKETGSKTRLPDRVFEEIAKAKRQEHLRKTAQY